MPSALGIVGSVSNVLQSGGAALSLINASKALIKSEDTALPGIDGFIFDISETDEVTLSSQVTESYTESNVAISDHITLDPIKITLTGTVGELIQHTSKVEKFIQQAIDRLQPVLSLQPALSSTAVQALAAISRAQSAALSASTIVDNTFGTSATDSVFGSSLTSAVGKTRQQKAFSALQQKWLNRKFITVQTPWLTFKNMIIENVTFSQSADTVDETNISITFKEVRTVDVATNVGTLKGRIAAQKSDVVDKGTASGKKGPDTLQALGGNK